MTKTEKYFNGHVCKPPNPLTCCPLHLNREVSERAGELGITKTVGSEVSKLSHAWTLRYKTCLYALVEDFMVAGGMRRKMIASRHQYEREGGRGGGHPQRAGSGRSLMLGGGRGSGRPFGIQLRKEVVDF